MKPFHCSAFTAIFLALSLTACIEFTTGCAHPQSGAESELALRIERFKYDGFDAIDLGVPQPEHTENSHFVIQHNPEAIPLLVAVLRDYPNYHYRQIGFAAYCLRAMKTDAGRKPAAVVFAKLDKMKRTSPDEIFAHNELRLYLEELAGNSN